MNTTKIYLNYLSNEEKVNMTNALAFLRKDDKASRKMFERIAGEIYGPDRRFDYPADNGHRPSEGSSRNYEKTMYLHTVVQFEQKDLTAAAIEHLGKYEGSWDWRYFYAIAVGKDDRKMYLVSFSNACSPNWNNEYNIQRYMELKDVDFPILKADGLVYRMCDSLHAAINAELWGKQEAFTEGPGYCRMMVRDQHGNYTTIEGCSAEDVFRDYADNYTGYRNYRRQMASEWVIVDDAVRESFKEWQQTANGLKSDFDKFYGGGIVD